MTKADISILSPHRYRVLEALAKYRYMTSDQFVSVGISENRDSVNENILPPLHKRSVGKLINFAEFGIEPGRGRRPRVYFLTKAGAQVLADFERCDISEITFPAGGVQYTNDYDHRKAYVDYLISFHKWIEAVDGDILDERHYFDFVGSNRRGTESRAETRVEFSGGYIIPDGLAHFQALGKARAVAVEIHRRTSPKRCADQLRRHMEAIKERAVMDRFGIEHASLVLSVSADQGLFERVRARMLEVPDWRHFAPLFRFATVEAVRADFGRAWVYADGTPAPFKAA